MEFRARGCLAVMFALAALTAKCGEDLPAVAIDAGVVDGGTFDTGAHDAGVRDAGHDAGSIDAGEPDAGAVDAGSDAGFDAGAPDAGTLDAGSVDAGTRDAGEPDAGIVDAGALDAGSLDAGSNDAGVFDAGPIDSGVALGTLDNPIEIDTSILPAWYLDIGDTSASSSREFDNYPPSDLQLSGPEVFYRFTLQQPAKITLTVASTPSAHLYAALLTKVQPAPSLWGADAGSVSDSKIDNTIGRDLVYDSNGFLEPGTQLDVGSYFIVIDSPDDSTSGAYEMRLKLALMPTLCTIDTTPTPDGTPSEVDYQNGCPPGMLMIPDSPPYCIDKYEGMLVGIDDAGTPFPWSPYVNPGSQKVRALSVANVIPQAYMDKNRALAACTLAGKRLCNYHEWLRACRGSATTTYPYGNIRDQDINPASPPASWDPQGDACDDARWVHSAVEYFSYFGMGSSTYVFSHLTHPCIDQLPQGLDPTGWRTRCVSQDGVLDMMGNVHEWIDESDVSVASGGTKSVPPGHGAFAGGYYMDTYLNGPGCDYLTTAHTPDEIDESTGFRCCADAP